MDTPRQIIGEIIGEKEDLIKITPEQSSFISAPCYSWTDFTNKIGALASLLEMNVEALRKVLPTYEKSWKGVKLLKALFEEKGKHSDEVENAIDLLRDIITLRNKIAPYHIPSERESSEILKKLGIVLTASSPTEWQKNADILLRNSYQHFRR